MPSSSSPGKKVKYAKRVSDNGLKKGKKMDDLEEFKNDMKKMNVQELMKVAKDLKKDHEVTRDIIPNLEYVTMLGIKNREKQREVKRALRKFKNTLNFSNAERQQRFKERREQENRVRRNIYVHFQYVDRGFKYFDQYPHMQPVVELCLNYMFAKGIPEKLCYDAMEFFKIYGFNVQKFYGNNKQPSEEV